MLASRYPVSLGGGVDLENMGTGAEDWLLPVEGNGKDVEILLVYFFLYKINIKAEIPLQTLGGSDIESLELNIIESTFSQMHKVKCIFADDMSSQTLKTPFKIHYHPMLLSHSLFLA